MTDYTFKLAQSADKPLIIKFMDENWGSKHPLIHDPLFFSYYYEGDNALQFALCYKNDKPVALCGYILANKNKSPDIWISIWVALKGENGAGLELMAALPKMCNAKVMACNNIRPKTMAFYRFLGYTADRLPHFYRLADKKSYQICKIQDKKILPINSGKHLVKINKSELSKCYIPNESNCPFKDLWYISRRYFNFPHQSYDVWRLDETTTTDALLVTRTVDVEGFKVVRVVDFTGSPASFASFGYGIDNLLQQENAEYADMYCFGIEKDEMARAGFCEREENSVNIIPNYLNPPLYENTEYYFFTTAPSGFTMFKADGDQDRPNVVV